MNATTRHSLKALTAALALAPLAALSVPDNSPKYEIRAKRVAVKLSSNGEIVGVLLGGLEKAPSARTTLAGCAQVDSAKAARLAAGGFEFTRTLRHLVAGRAITVADQMAGCGAYSGDENPIDVAKFRKMAFRVN
jgi:hypothetical protein